MRLTQRIRTIAPYVATLGLALGGLVGCYTVDFDEAESNVFYCQSDDECLDTQACSQFRCVDNRGPQVRIGLPEPLTLVDDGSIEVAYELADFRVAEGDGRVDGEGKILVELDDGSQLNPVLSTNPEGIQLDVSSLRPGPHRLFVEAVFGDGTPYGNPGARDFIVFFIPPDDARKPQVAFVSPPPGHVHIVGEPLNVELVTRDFQFRADPPGAVCEGQFLDEDLDDDDECDPFDNNPDTTCATECAAACSEECRLTKLGHPHVYLEPDYPGCLFDEPISCNGSWVLSLDANAAEPFAENSRVDGTIAATRFSEPGVYRLSVSLQYNDHDPYPTRSHVIFDSFEIEVIER